MDIIHGDKNNILDKLPKKYDANKKTAYDLEIENDLASVYDKILDILSDEFGLSKSQSYDILSLGSSEYTSKVNAIAAK